MPFQEDDSSPPRVPGNGVSPEGSPEGRTGQQQQPPAGETGTGTGNGNGDGNNGSAADPMSMSGSVQGQGSTMFQQSGMGSNGDQSQSQNPGASSLASSGASSTTAPRRGPRGARGARGAGGSPRKQLGAVPIGGGPSPQIGVTGPDGQPAPLADAPGALPPKAPSQAGSHDGSGSAVGSIASSRVLPPLRRYQRRKGMPAPGLVGSTVSEHPSGGEGGEDDAQAGLPGAVEESEFVDGKAQVRSMAWMQDRQPSKMHDDVFFVENIATGEFQRVSRDQLARAEKEKEEQRKKALDRTTAFKIALDTLGGWLAASFHFAQGVLGGFALLQLFFTLRTTHETFLDYYAPISSDAQRIFLTLTTLSLLSAVDKYAKDKMANWNGRGLWQRSMDLFIIFCYVVAFSFSLANAQYDDVFTFSNNRIPRWWTLEPLSEEWIAIIDRWHIFNGIRIAFAVIGWFCVCTESRIRAYSFNADNKLLWAMSMRTSSTAVAKGNFGVSVTG